MYATVIVFHSRSIDDRKAWKRICISGRIMCKLFTYIFCCYRGCTEAEKYNKRVRICNPIALLLIAAYMLLKDTGIYMDNHIIRNSLDFAQGLAVGMLFVGLIMSSRYGAKVRAFKQRIFMKNNM